MKRLVILVLAAAVLGSSSVAVAMQKQVGPRPGGGTGLCASDRARNHLGNSRVATSSSSTGARLRNRLSVAQRAKLRVLQLRKRAAQVPRTSTSVGR